MMWARSEWRRRWGSLLLLAGLVAVAGGPTIEAVAAARRTDTAFERMLVATNEPNLVVSALTDSGIGDLDPALLDQVMQIDGVEGATAIAFLAVSAEEYPTFFSIAILEERGRSSRPFYVEGPKRDQLGDMGADEVFLNEAMRDVLDVHPGTELHLQSATSEQFLAAVSDDVELGEPEGPNIDVRVAGVGRTPEEISDSKDPSLLFSSAFYDNYKDQLWSCRCIVQVLARPSAIADVSAQLALIYPDAMVGPTDNLGSRLEDSVALQVNTWILMAFTAGFAGALILLFACGRFVRSVTVADFSHRALGMTQRETRIGRFVIMAPAVLLGTCGAGGIAYAMSPFDPVGIARRAEPDPGLNWYWSIGGWGMLVALTSALFIAGVCSTVVRHRSDSLRHRVNRGGPVISLGSRLAAGPGRGAVLGVLVATLGTVGASTFDESIDHLLATPSLYGADFDAKVFEAVSNDELTVAAELAEDVDVAAVATAWTSNSADNEETMAVVGLDGSVNLTPGALESVKGTIESVVTDGRAPLLPNEVALGRVAMKELGVGIGDSLTIQGQLGSVEMTIVGEVLTSGVDTTGNGLVVTIDGLRTLTNPATDSTAVRYAAGADRAAVAARHPGLTIGPVIPPSEVGNVGELGDLPGSVAQLLLLLGFFALLNAGVLTVNRARREIAIHRAMGFTTPQVVGAHMWQSAIATLVGGSIGGFAGFVVGRAIHQKLANDVGAIAETVVPVSILTVAATAAIAMIVAALITSALTLRSRPGAVLRAE